MKFVFGLVLLISFSAFAQDADKLKQEAIKEQQAKIAKIKAEAGKNELSPQLKYETKMAENNVEYFKTLDVTKPSPGGIVGGYQPNSLWNCSLSHDEKEIDCANGKKYKITVDGDESERSEHYKQQWGPGNFNGPSIFPSFNATGSQL